MIATEVLEIIDRGIPVDSSVRVVHSVKSNGEVCSRGKDAAMSVRRTTEGYLCFCFRCGESFYFKNKRSSPSETLARLKSSAEPLVDVVEKASLPTDYQGMWKEGSIMTAAFSWLWSYHINKELFQKYEIGWSNYYCRIIFPVYDSILLSSGDVGKKLLGWVGRDPIHVPKEKRTTPKWLTKKEKGTKRFYFTCLSEIDKVVIVEDVVSAIRVHEASGWNSLALHTTSFPTDLMVKLSAYTVYVWLDANAVSKSVEYVSKLNSFGITAKLIYTSLDPKEYSAPAVRSYLFKENTDEVCSSI